MQKILLGIVAVFCLQATFQAYLAVEQSRDEYQAMARATPLNDSLENSPLETAGVSEPALSSDQMQPARVTTPRRASRAVPQASYAAYRRPVAKRIPDSVIARSFKTVTISYPTPARYQQASYIREPAAQPAVKKEKRSLPAKTFTVIKKPYEWLKAFASKFKG